MSAKRWTRLALLCALCGGCQRKAAGVPECRGLAYQMYGVHAGELVSQAVKERLDERIRECLLTPYDRELVRCLEQGGRDRICKREFVERRLAADDHYQPRFR